MMLRLASIVLFLCAWNLSFSQDNGPGDGLNLGFENEVNGVPDGWTLFGTDGYKAVLDSTEVHGGKFAVSLEFIGESKGYRAWSYKLPSNYNGKKITLSGYMRTEGVTDGFAGLWMRIDPSIAFDNMQRQSINGSTAWTKYEITLQMDPGNTKGIVIGGLLAGKGKVWFDDFQLRIDGKDIRKAKPFEKKDLPADNDNAFDYGSGINTINLNEQQLQYLKKLGMVWGFVKYYHPSVAQGKYYMDYELFRVMPTVLNAQGDAAFDSILTKWVSQFGPIEKQPRKEKRSGDIKFGPDLDWIVNSGFSDALSTRLIDIKRAKRPDNHYYIGFEPTGNAKFMNEGKYDQFKYPDAGYRLLALFKYWNMIQYYFPYRDLIGEDWKGVLEEFIPELINAKNEVQYVLAMKALTARINDSHAGLYAQSQAFREYIGVNYAMVQLLFIENKAIVSGFYSDQFEESSNLKIGDEIITIDGQSIAEVLDLKLKYIAASNYPVKLRNVAYELMRSNDSAIDVTYIRNGTKGEVKITAYQPEVFKEIPMKTNRDTFRMIGKDIVYIDHGLLKRAFLPELWDSMKDTKGIIIDMRNYPSDFPIYAFSAYLLSSSRPFTLISNPDQQVPGQFIFEHRPLRVGAKGRGYEGIVAILINETTQSSSEFHAMAYRTHSKAVVIGSTTAGADGNVSRIVLPGDLHTAISGIGIYYPDGSETQRVGIVPDVFVEPTVEGVMEGRDEVLDKAIEIIRK